MKRLLKVLRRHLTSIGKEQLRCNLETLVWVWGFSGGSQDASVNRVVSRSLRYLRNYDLVPVDY